MNSITHPECAVKPTTAEELTGRLRRAGYLPGIPSHLEAWARLVDAGLCAEMECGHCGNTGGLDYRPFHRGRCYVALAVCGRCHHAEEV